MEVPEFWRAFRDEHGLAGRSIRIPEDDDPSEEQAAMLVFTDVQIVAEATKYFPGIAAVKSGYVPVGGCEWGSGDPFFVRAVDGPGGALYQIDHEAVAGDETLIEEGVEVVLGAFARLVEYVEGE